MRRRLLLGAAVCATAPVPAWSGQGPIVPEVVLVDHQGRRWRLAELIGPHPVVVSFFYVACTTICPPQTGALLLLQEELARRAFPGHRPLLLSISLDPLGDTPGAMLGYAKRFGIELGLEQGWLMLTGPLPALAQVWAAFEAPAGQPEDHAAIVWLSQTGRRRWVRASALAPPEALADLLLSEGT